MGGKMEVVHLALKIYERVKWIEPEAFINSPNRRPIPDRIGQFSFEFICQLNIL